MNRMDSGSRRLATWRSALDSLLLVLIVGTVFGARLTVLPVRGEESRWAAVAVQMIDTGDWVVPRQQGRAYIDRPPLAQWAMAVVGLLAGEVDLLAIRLPSVLSVVGVSLLVYWYGRTFLSSLGALAAALVFASFGQVLQIGRLGENEALYCLVVSGSLLVWGRGYSQGWRPAVAWCLGYGLAALAALIKGPQGPAYFLAATTVYLVVRRDWRWLIGWHQPLGVLVFVLVFACWQVPFYMATGWEDTIGMWTRTSAHRYAVDGLLEHMATYPLETLICLLPWSPLLLALARPAVRRHLGGWPPQLVFLVTAIAVTYPSVWLAAEAKGRYFMPLYPAIALLIGFIVERSALAARDTAARRGWDFYLGVLALLMAAGGVGIGVASTGVVAGLDRIAQPGPFAGLFLLASLAGAATLYWSRRREGEMPARLVLLTIVAYLGLAYTGAVINSAARRANDLTAVVDRLKAQLDDPRRLISFGPIDHRFAFYYRDFIVESDWPLAPGDVPPGADYFCYEHHRGDTAELRRNGRGIYWGTTPGNLPFRWEELARIPCDRNVRDDPEVTVVVGRIVQPERLAETAASSNR